MQFNFKNVCILVTRNNCYNETEIAYFGAQLYKLINNI